MASDVLRRGPCDLVTAEVVPHENEFSRAALVALWALASLKATVVLFALAIVLVLVGTLAQVEHDINRVISQYFRTFLAWVELQVFFPPAFFPSRPRVPGGFYFPGGWTIGIALFINLIAAHAIRFKIQAGGQRLAWGLAVIALGIVVTMLVVVSGSNKDGVYEGSIMSWSSLWMLFKLGLGAMWLAAIYGLMRLDAKQRIERWLLVGVGVVVGGLLVLILVRGDQAQLSASSMRILWQLIKAGVAALILLGGCALVFKKRAGIVLLHTGVGLMMFNELFVGLTAVETQMAIAEGETVNYAHDIRTLEIALIDPSDPKFDDVVVIPKSIFLERRPNSQGGEGYRVVSHPELPIDLQVVKFVQNSRLRRLTPSDKDRNPADSGVGLAWFAEEIPPVTGTDSDGEVDKSCVYVRCFSKEAQRHLGTFLLSLAAGNAEPVNVDGKTYELTLRFRRHYKPYAVTLLDVRKDDYVGTSTPRNYSSDIHLVDDERHVDRKIRIWMNNPLRFAGETFYQSGYNLDPQSGTEYTTLAVVTNDGWMIPYVGCMIVATGMLAQFLIVLTRFLRRESLGNAPEPSVQASVAAVARGGREPGRGGEGGGAADKGKHQAEGTSPQPAAARQAPPGPARQPDRRPQPAGETSSHSWAGTVKRWFPLAVVVVFGLYFASKMPPPRYKAGDMDLTAFGRLPVAFEGRVKPIDTLARNNLRIISDRQDFKDGPYEKRSWLDVFRGKSSAAQKQPALRWLLDVIARNEIGRQHRVIKINHPEVLDLLGLEPRSDHLYSYNEVTGNAASFEELIKQSSLAHQTPKEQLSPFQKKVLELENKLGVYDLLEKSFSPTEIRDDRQREDMIAALQTLESLSRRNPPPPLAVPIGTEERPWETYAFATLWDYFQRRVQNEPPHPATVSLTKIFNAYARGDAQTFNEAVASYERSLHQKPPQDYLARKIAFESYFNHVEPFYYSAVLYLVAFVLASTAWLVWRKPLNRAAFWLIVLTLVIHTLALAGRIYISGRPPVTNLYSSAVFIGWGCVILALVLELIFRQGIGNIIAGMTGFGTLLIAHLLTTAVPTFKGDTFTVMQAVLDTQFWLATHVVCITLGYSTTFLAGGLGVLYVGLGLFTPTLDQKLRRELTRMIYGTLCFAIFFSFVGTVLGGLWADDSWGRFWGWDPKENGALIIVLWNALVLHARWGGMIKDRGLAVLSIGGNIVTAWSWFGVNELGVGLHSYGFTEGVLAALAMFAMSQLMFIAAGLLPKELWWSLRAEKRTQVQAA
jgi:ABC-type transport system involved in cytochrome c biogenesis permease subunit